MSTHVLAAVLTRLKLLTGAQSDAELSRALSVSPQTLSSWKVRDSIPYSLCIDIARQHACSLDWLLLGQAEHNATSQVETSWEGDMLERLRTLSPSDRQAILLFIKDKQRIQQLEQQLSELGG
ncbi:helix-turn-helix domain-containing protein [Pseudomonas sp. TWI929]|uniref:helix-turn-helix domain-containing protein n=1 Tax=Pseudomonas sp. TWI929 TaxID=3136795 RepID=UPI00320B893C